MFMISGERWHCTNVACRYSILVENSGHVAGSNPRCSCGSVMKKNYSPPVVREIKMLDFPEPVLILNGSERE